MLLEICTHSVQSAINAQKAGASRIELCQNLNEGGTTPSWATIEYCVKQLKINTMVLVRPRVGDFCYSDVEFEVVRRDVMACRELGATGVVVGFLHPDGSVDVEKTKEIVQLAGNMEVTFHRAFDVCRHPLEALEQIIGCGCRRLLTSGLKKMAWEGIDNLRAIVRQAEGRIIIMAGSGINAENAVEIVKQTGVQEIHASCKRNIVPTTDYQEDKHLDKSNWMHAESNEEEIRKILNQLKINNL